MIKIYGVKREGFTLAEVLITLGIIGVIAALTLPTLIAKHRKQEVETKLKKVYTVMNQAFKLAEVQHGDIRSVIKDCGPSNATTCSLDDVEEWFNTYLKPHLNILKTEKHNEPKALFVYFNDGSILRISLFVYDMAFYTNKRAMSSDKAGINSFMFRFNPVLLPHQQNAMEKEAYHLSKNFEPYAWDWDGTREGLLEGRNYAAAACKGLNRNYCTKLIQIEGWKIPDDYPHRF